VTSKLLWLLFFAWLALDVAILASIIVITSAMIPQSVASPGPTLTHINARFKGHMLDYLTSVPHRVPQNGVVVATLATNERTRPNDDKRP
jgi:hypothetical protein